jgi:hypothetical protein
MAGLLDTDDPFIGNTMAEAADRPAAVPDDFAGNTMNRTEPGFWQRVGDFFTPAPDDGKPDFVSRLGLALGGGSEGLTPAEQSIAGRRALLNAGLSMLSRSSESTMDPRPGLGNYVAGGIAAAEQTGLTAEQTAQARRTAAGELALKQQALGIHGLDAKIKLAQFQYLLGRLKAGDSDAERLRKQWGGDGDGSTPGTSGTPGAGGGSYEGSVIATEGTAKNPRSSAVGPGQFLDETWTNFAKANPELFPGMSAEQILAARTDPNLGPVLATKAVTWLAQQNATALAAAGVTPSGPSLRVAHYLGAGAAAKVMAAPDDAPVKDFVSAKAVEANPELATMTAGQLRARYAGTPDPAFLGRRTAGPTPPPSPPPSGASSPPAPAARPAPPPAGAPPPAADVAPNAGNQTAGPGAPSGGVVAPPGPGVAGDVGAIIGGMTARGADPATLAPGTARPAGAPPTQTADAGPTWPPRRSDGATIPGLIPEEPPASFNAPYLEQLATARNAKDPQAAIAAVAAARAKALDEYRQNARAHNTEMVKQDLQLQAQQRLKQQEIDAAAALKQREIEADLAKQQDQQRATAMQSEKTASMQVAHDRLKEYDKEAAPAGDAMRAVENLRLIAPHLGKPDQVAASYPEIRGYAQQFNIGTPEDQARWTAQDAWTNFVNRGASLLRPPGSGNTSDKDFAAYRSSFGSLANTPEGREIGLAMIYNGAKRTRDEARVANEYFEANHKRAGMEDYVQEKLGDMIKTPPPLLTARPEMKNASAADKQLAIAHDQAAHDAYVQAQPVGVPFKMYAPLETTDERGNKRTSRVLTWGLHTDDGRLLVAPLGAPR